MRIAKALLACLFAPAALLAQNWIQQTPPTSPPARDGAAMVYDSARHQTVLFGGEDSTGTPLNDTWVYDGTTWTQLHPAASPPARLWHGMAFDAGHGQVVLFGGCSSATTPLAYLNDTWLWDGVNWTNAAPVTAPSARQGPAMAYDPSISAVVLFGGAASVPGGLQDTWRWNGTNWSQILGNPPPGRRFASMSFDAARGAMVLFGGDNGTTTLNDTWTFKGSEAWHQVFPAHSPSARSTQGQAWDPVRNLTVMFGGGNAADTWLWNGTDWTQETTVSSPPARAYVAMAYDIQHDYIVLFGGQSTTASGDYNDTWIFGSNYTESWMQLSGPTWNPALVGPVARVNAAAAAESTDVLVFGGFDGTTVQNDTWQWFGDQWTVLAPGASPPARQNSAMAHDSNGNIVLFGGNSSAGGTALLADTWLWNGSNWTPPSPAASPSAREGQALVYDADPAIQNTVLFGGFTGSYAADTWLWNGSNWSQPDLAASPTARAYHSAVYDAARHQVVLFGGFNGAYLNDTWVWDGTTWTQQMPATSPPARDRFSMVYDSVHGTVQIFGGQNASGALSDTWSWDGVNWTQLTPAVSPSARYGAASAYLAPAGQFFTYGGTDGASNFQEGWVFASPFVATATLPVGFSGQSYSYTIAPAGGVAPYTFTANGIPESFASAGLSLNPSTGAITGTDSIAPGQPPAAFGVTIQDSQGQSTLLSFKFLSDSPLVLSPSVLPDATMGANYGVTLSATGGTAPYTFSATGLPAGLSFTGTQIVGQCTAGSTGVSLGVVDSLGATASVGPLTVHCNAPPSIITASPLPNGIVGVAYSATLTMTGGTAPIMWTLTPGTLPLGFALSSTGVLTGTATSPVTSTFSVTVSDLWLATASKSFTVTFYPVLTIVSSSLPNGSQGSPYPAGTVLAVSGGTGAGTYTFSATGLPNGLTINSSSGAITGTPTASGTFHPTFTVTDQTPQTATQTIALTVTPATPLVLSPTALPDATAGANYLEQLSATGGVPSYTFSASGLPAGLHLNSSNQIVGQCTAASTNVVLTVTDSATPTANQTSVGPLTVHCNAAPSITSTSPLPNGIVGVAYSATLTMTGGTAPISWTLTPGTLPSGFSLSSTGVLTGTATSPVSSTFSVTVSDLWLATANKSFTVTFYPVLTIASSSALPNGVQGAPYPSGTALAVNGGTGAGTYTFSATGLPNGLTIDSASGAITGTPTQSGTFHPTFTVTDQTPQTAIRVLALTVTPASALVLSPTTLPDATAGYNYLEQLSATGGVPAYTFSAAGLPAGLHLNSSNQIVGQCTAASTNVVLTVTDSATPTANQTSVGPLTVHCNAAPSITSTSPLPNGIVGVPYTAALTASGGTAPISWTLTPGTLPSGFTLSSTGVLTGTATSPVSATFSATVSDLWTNASKSFTVTFYPVLTITSSSLPNGLVGSSYPAGAVLAVSGGTGAGTYTFSATGLPSGLTIDSSSGAITGTPTVSGTFHPTFTVTDQTPQTATQNLTLTVLSAPGVLFETTSPLPAGTPNVPYSTTVTATGGTGSLNFSASGLPSWLTLNGATGVLSGTPPSAGPVTFQLTVSDTIKQSLTENFTLPVNAVEVFGVTPPLPPATVNIPYSDTLTASGGSGSYTWSATGLPSWLTLTPGGVLSGTPPAAGAVSFRVTVSDTAHNTVGETFTLPVIAALTVETSLPPATANFPYLATFMAAGGGGGYQWSATGLPGGFSLSPSGVLSGTPPSATPIAFNVTVKDALNNIATQAFTLPVNAADTVNTSSPLPPATVLIPYSTNLTASGGNPGYTWTASGLPAWLNLTAAGYLSGTPPAGTGNVSFQATVTDFASNSASATFTLPVEPSLAITTAALPAATANVLYSTALAAIGGVGSYTWSATGLPAGLTLSAAGVLTGTPAAGSYPFTATVYDTETSVASKNFTLTVSTPVSTLSFVTSSLAPCVVNVSCADQVAAAGGVPPYIFSLAKGASTDGLSISTNGLLSGTPTASGQFNIPVIVADQQTSISQTFPLTVYATLAISTTTLPGGTVGVYYGIAAVAGGGQPPYTWSLYSGSLPPGLKLDPLGGNIFGTPTAAGTYTFFLQVRDAFQSGLPQQLSITIAGTPPLPLTVVSPSNLPPGTVGTPYSYNLSAIGGSGQYTWKLAGGSLPTGLTLAATGAITGTPTAAQMAGFSATVSDTAANSVTVGFTLFINGSGTVALLTPNPLPNGAVGVPYNYGLQVTGGTPVYFFSITAGQVPPGLTFDQSTGTFSGTPTQSGNFSITLTVSDSGHPRSTVSGNYTIAISGAGSFQISTANQLPNGFINQGYSTQLAASGGKPPYQWHLVSGSLPAGLALLASGQIVGTPTVVGVASFVIGVVDSTGATATAAFALWIVDPAKPTISIYPPLPPGAVGVRYASALSAAGGNPPYTWSIVAGALPPGLTLDPLGGNVSGTPTLQGNFPVTVQITDSSGASGTQSLTIRVNSAALKIAPATIPNATVNVPYSFPLTATGGTAPYTWSLSAGSLLTGFSIDPLSGVISGTPIAAGTYPFTISVVDSNFGIASQAYQLIVQSTGIGILPLSAPAATVGSPYSLTLSTPNAAPPVTWSSSGSLPPGIQFLAASSQLSGTPTAAGSYTFTIRATDATTATAQVTYTLVVNPQPFTILTTTLPGGAAGTAYSQTLQSSGGKAPVVWSVTGTLPAGLSLGGSTGTISGTPTVTGSFSFTVEATDSTGATAPQQPLTLTIGAPPAAPTVTLSGLPATSTPGAQPTVTIGLANAYPLPIVVTATLTLAPNPGNSTDLMFASGPAGARTTQITIPANTTQATLAFQTGTLPGTIQLSLHLSAAGVDITPSVPPAASTTIAKAAPVISSVAVATTSTGFQVTIVGLSTTLDMTTAAFHFTPSAGATLTTTDISLNVSSMFSAWYANPASLATGSQFALTVPFTVAGNISTIASVTVTLTNSVGASAAATAKVP